MGIWSADIPTGDGWYWIKYKGKRGQVVCPCQVSRLYGGAFIQTARNDSFTETTRDSFGFADAEFGPAIPWPE